jgi:DNA-binding transcriptional MerR regulator
VADEDLLTIGRFARLSGLSIGALRHYDELDLLRPARVARFTGYRAYHRDQVERARTIGRLRDLEVPLDEAFAAGDLERTPRLSQMLADLMVALEQDEGQKLGGKSAEAARFILRAISGGLDDA